MYRRFGARVTVVDKTERLMSQLDVEMSAQLANVFAEEGIELRLGVSVTRIASSREGVRLEVQEGAAIIASHLLVAVGRTPNSDDLGCAAAGIRTDKHGYIEVDDNYRTSAEGVYAVGDVTPGPQFTHAAWDDHRRLLRFLLEGRPAQRSRRLVPWTVFTDPQIAGAGLSEHEARAKHLSYEVARFEFGHIARAIETNRTAGSINVLIGANEEILGCIIMGAEAGELIHIPLAVMAAGASARSLVDAEFVHPTFAEGVQSALLRLPRFA